MYFMAGERVGHIKKLPGRILLPVKSNRKDPETTKLPQTISQMRTKASLWLSQSEVRIEMKELKGAIEYTEYTTFY